MTTISVGKKKNGGRWIAIEISEGKSDEEDADRRYRKGARHGKS